MSSPHHPDPRALRAAGAGLALTGGAFAAGGAVLAVSGLLVRRAGSNEVGTRERRWFHRMNRPLGMVEAPVWAAMQFGNGLTTVVVPVALLVTGSDRRTAARSAVAAGSAWHLAKVVKRLIPRERPARLLDGVALRDGDPGGAGFVSGHTAVATATAMAVGPGRGTRTRIALGAAALTVGFARVHVGAHLPLDVLGGAGLGLIVGAASTLVVPTAATPDAPSGVPAGPDARSDHRDG